MAVPQYRILQRRPWAETAADTVTAADSAPEPKAQPEVSATAALEVSGTPAALAPAEPADLARVLSPRSARIAALPKPPPWRTRRAAVAKVECKAEPAIPQETVPQPSAHLARLAKLLKDVPQEKPMKTPSQADDEETQVDSGCSDCGGSSPVSAEVSSRCSDSGGSTAGVTEVEAVPKVLRWDPDEGRWVPHHFPELDLEEDGSCECNNDDWSSACPDELEEQGDAVEKRDCTGTVLDELRKPAAKTKHPLSRHASVFVPNSVKISAAGQEKAHEEQTSCASRSAAQFRADAEAFVPKSMQTVAAGEEEKAQSCSTCWQSSASSSASCCTGSDPIESGGSYAAASHVSMARTPLRSQAAAFRPWYMMVCPGGENSVAA